MADYFLQSVDSTLEQTYSKVSKNLIIQYEKETIKTTVKSIGNLMS